MSFNAVNKFGRPGSTTTKKILTEWPKERIVNINNVGDSVPDIDVFQDLPFNNFNGKIYLEFLRSVAWWGNGNAATTKTAQINFTYTSGPSETISKDFSAGVSNDCFQYGGMIAKGILIPPYSDTGYPMNKILIDPLPSEQEGVGNYPCGETITTGRLYF